MTERAEMPRWAKVSLIVVGVLIAVAAVLKLTGIGGEHGPSRHMSPVDHGAPAGLTTD